MTQIKIHLKSMSKVHLAVKLIDFFQLYLLISLNLHITFIKQFSSIQKTSTFFVYFDSQIKIKTKLRFLEKKSRFIDSGLVVKLVVKT